MLTILSSAKTLDWEKNYQIPEITQPRLIDKADIIARRMKGYSKKQLQDVLGVSDSLADLNFNRYRSWKKEHTIRNARPAIASYAGQVFQKLELMAYTNAQKRYLQKSIRILSGLYGVLRPFDLIEPYRLEMATNIQPNGAQNLYDFWKDDLSTLLRDDIAADHHNALINLASREYSDAVLLNTMGIPVIDIVFKQRKNGVLRSFGIPTKQARADMLAFIIRHTIEEPEDLQKFNEDEYRLEGSTDTEMVFVRNLPKRS